MPEIPIHITRDDVSKGGIKDMGFLDGSFGAVTKWFSDGESSGLNLDYLEQFGNTILPYELVLPPNPDSKCGWDKATELRNIEHMISLQPSLSLKQFEDPSSTSFKQFQNAFSFLLKQSSPTLTFHRFNAPLSLFLHACQSSNPLVENLYIAQAQLADLPRELRADLPTPNLVLKAGKGDIYDSNLWLGLPPTYTPLHKDPNPNLFVQLVGRKRVTLFPPHVGRAMFRLVQERVGGGGNASARGEEMMEGEERGVLDELVWGSDGSGEGREVDVQRGEGLFIPKGWWHCVKSLGEGVNGSVNWWFR